MGIQAYCDYVSAKENAGASTESAEGFSFMSIPSMKDKDTSKIRTALDAAKLEASFEDRLAKEAGEDVEYFESLERTDPWRGAR